MLFMMALSVSANFNWFWRGSMFKVVCTSKYTKKFVEDGEERSIASYCTHEEKTNFKGFP